MRVDCGDGLAREHHREEPREHVDCELRDLLLADGVSAMRLLDEPSYCALREGEVFELSRDLRHYYNNCHITRWYRFGVM